MKTLKEKIDDLKVIIAEAWPTFDWSKNLLEILTNVEGDTAKIGNLSSLETTAQTTIVAAINELVADVKTLEDIHYMPTVTISALSNSTLNAEQAAAAGFDEDVLAFLMIAHNPTIEFSDMCVSFSAVETVSEGVVKQYAMLVHEASGVVSAYKAVLTLNSTGAVTYTATALS